MRGNDDGLRVGTGKMLGGGVGWVEAVDVRWEWGGGWSRRGLLGEGSGDGGPRRPMSLSLPTFGWGWRRLFIL